MFSQANGRVVAKLLKNKHIFHLERLNFRPFATTPVLLSYRGAVLSPWISEILKRASLNFIRLLPVVITPSVTSELDYE